MTDAGYSTKNVSSVAGSKKKVINEFALARMYKDKNIRVNDICASLGISPVIMYDRLRKMGIKTRQDPQRKGKRLTASTIRKIYTMHVIGHTRHQIAKTLKIAPSTVTHHLNKGIPAELYTPPAQQIKPTPPIMMATITSTVKPSLWDRIKGWFN